MRVMRLRRVMAALAVAVALIPAVAAADPPGASSPQTVASSPPTTVQSVTVTPPPPATPPPAAAVHAFVQSHATPTHIGQLPRWSVPVCAKVAGVDPQRAAAIVARVVDLAKRVGAPAADPAHCHANFAILVSDDPQAVLDYVKKHQPVLLGYHYPDQTQRIATVRYPIQAWYVTASGGRGRSVAVTIGGGQAGMGSGFATTGGSQPSLGGSAATIDDSCCSVGGGVAGSRLTSQMTSAFAAVVVVVDARVLANHDEAFVGDYVGVIGLSEANLSQPCGPLPSVLDAFAAACADADAVTEATANDVAFLKALYATDPSNPEWMQRSSIADLMHRAATHRQDVSPATR
jgi:hypothetical protein